MTHFGYCSSETGRSIPAHSHLGHEFLYVKSGDAPITMAPGKVPLELHRQDCILVVPGHEHSFVVPSCGASYYWLGIQVAQAVMTSDSNHLPQHSLLSRKRNRVHLVGPDQKYEDLRSLANAVSVAPIIVLRQVPEVGVIFRDIEIELDDFTPPNHFMIYAKLIELFAIFQKHANRTWVEHTPEMVQRVAYYVRANLEASLSVDELAHYAGVSPRQIQRLFRKYLRCSPSAFVDQQRIQRACEILLSGVRPIDVAREVGYRSTGLFFKRFKLQMGQTPGQYQKGKTAQFENRPKEGL